MGGKVPIFNRNRRNRGGIGKIDIPGRHIHDI
jgi:hypothetical protein